MILCIGLIIAVYTITRLGLEGSEEIFMIGPGIKSVTNLVSTGLIVLLTIWMISLSIMMELRLERMVNL